jgi:hypothetical protein
VTDTEHHRINSLAEKARSAMSNAEQDDHVKQAAIVAKDVEANHSRQSPGSDDDRSPCRSGSSRQESGTKRGGVTIKFLIPVAATGGCASSCTGE